MANREGVKVYDTTWQKIIDNANVTPEVKQKIKEKMETKKCSKCGRELPVSEFTKNSTRKDGLQSYCKTCQREVSLKWWNEHHPKEKKTPEPEIIDGITVTPVVQETLKRYSDAEIINELRGRGVNVLLNPKPRDLILALKKLGYEGTLVFYEKHEININNFE